MPPLPPDKVMHAEMRIGQATVFASDGMCSGTPTFTGFQLSVAVDSAAQATQFFNALAAGGQVRMPLGKTFFADSFGMVTDRYGVQWMIIAGVQG